MGENKVSILNESNEKLIGIETIPEIEKDKYPTVILAHGFGVTKEEGGMFDQIAEHLAENGILVYRFDFSGRGESEGDYSKTSLSKLKSDQNKILEFVRSQEKVDSNNIGILGQSFGTSTTVTLEPQVKAIVLMGSVAHPKELLGKILGEGYNPEGLSIRKKPNGTTIEVDSQFWKDFKNHDLLKSMSQIECPVLFIHGSDDEKVPVSEMEDYIKVTKNSKKLVLEGALHSLKPKRDEMYKAVVDWFKEHLIEEKVFFTNSKNQKLCGILNEPTKKGEMVVIVHGFGSSKNTSAKNSASILARLNINSFRIDLNGCGESEGNFEECTITDYAEDVESTINFVKEKGYNKISLIGTSCGGIVCMAVALKHPEIQRMFLRAPVSDYPSQREEFYGKEMIQEWKEKGYMYKTKSDGTKLKVNYTFYEDAKNNVMYDKVKDIKCPAMIIHGDIDKTVSIEDSKKVVQNFPNAKLAIIKGAGHKLGVNGDFSQASELLKNFFKPNLFI